MNAAMPAFLDGAHDQVMSGGPERAPVHSFAEGPLGHFHRVVEFHSRASIVHIGECLAAGRASAT